MNNLDFALPSGAHLVITGPSGSGKTSLGMALVGKLFVTGALTVHPSLDIKNTSGQKIQMVDQRHTIKNRSNTVDGYYQQRYNSLDNEDAYTVEEELLAVKDDLAQIKAHLAAFGIDYLLDKTLLTLSSGEHKRFQLVKMLLSPAGIVILDEPFVGLDVQARAALNLLLEDLTKKGIQLVTLTGARDHFPSVATHVVELMDGKASYFGELKDYRPGFHPAIERYDLSSLNLAGYFANNEVNQDNTAATEPIIKMEDLHIAYADKIIFDNLNWQVLPGERWLLKGPNGAGKSTLLSLIYGDNPRAYANKISLFGKRRGTGESIWDIKSKMGFVSPELHAFFDKNILVHQAVASGFFDTMGLYKKLSDRQMELLDNWLQVLGLSPIKNKRLQEISTGQQRLIMLLRAFIKNPPLLILDEPCQGLDEWQTEAFVRLVEDYCNLTGASLIYISHYASEVPSVVDQVLELLGDGKGGYRQFKTPDAKAADLKKQTPALKNMVSVT